MHDSCMFDWGYETEVELPERPSREAMRAWGGRVVINVMAYTRGQPQDYDRWRRRARSAGPTRTYCRISGGRNWEGGDNPWRGGAGPLGTEFAKTPDTLFDAWVEAGKAVGIPQTDDYNGKQQEGFGRGQYTIRDGRRSSSARAYLRPAKKRPNLTVETGAHATRVLLQGTRATGVDYVTDAGNTKRADAGRDVIISTGAFNAPAAPDAVGHRPGGASARVGSLAWPICRSGAICRTLGAY